MKKNKLAFAVLLCIPLALMLIPISSRVQAMPLDEPLLYYNDSTWLREDRAPLRMIDGVYYVPLSIFPQLSNTKVRINHELNTFVITHGELYVSFDANTGIATNCFDDYLYIKTYKLDYSENYVPVAEVCRQLGLGYRTYTGKLTGTTALRITDGSEELDFKELLALYNPKILATTEDSSATVSETDSKKETSISETSANENTKPIKALGYRTIYLTFRGDLSAADRILELLSEQETDATFFITYSDILNSAEQLASILSNGHTIGILQDSDSYTDAELIEYFDKTNDLLYRVFKLKTRTVRLLSNAAANAVTDAGYNIWSYNLYSYDGYYSEYAASEAIIDGIFANNTAVIEFSSENSVLGVLGRVLEFIGSNRRKCTLRACLETFSAPF